MYEHFKDETINFVEKMKKTQSYIDYLNYKTFLENQPELLSQVNEFRKKSFEIQAGHKYGYFNAYENLLRLNEEYEDLLSEPIVKSFLNAELEVSKMINEVLNTFASEIDMDLDFLTNPQ